MKVSSIYHAPASAYPLLKSLGFSHVGLGTDYPQDQDYFLSCVKAAHDLGLHIIVAPKFYIYDAPTGLWVSKISEAKEMLENLKNELCMRCLVYLPDEANLHREALAPEVILMLHTLSKDIVPQCSTLAVLSWLRSYEGYQDTANVIGLDFYRPFLPDLWTTAKLVAKVLWFKAAHGGSLMAVPGIKISAAHIKRQARFWRALGINNFLWYSFFPNAENPPWLPSDLYGLPAIQEALKDANAES